MCIRQLVALDWAPGGLMTSLDLNWKKSSENPVRIVSKMSVHSNRASRFSASLQAFSRILDLMQQGFLAASKHFLQPLSDIFLGLLQSQLWRNRKPPLPGLSQTLVESAVKYTHVQYTHTNSIMVSRLAKKLWKMWLPSLFHWHLQQQDACFSPPYLLTL